MHTRFSFTLIMLLATILLSACSTKTVPTATTVPTVTPLPNTTSESTHTTGSTNAASLPNPASANCEEKGGKLDMHERGELGQYGVCVFEDNLQCEEWALFRGECPEGGVKVTGYATEPAVYCAITGGEYAVTGNSGAADEQGTCTFKNGTTCDVWNYFNGKCYPNQ